MHNIQPKKSICILFSCFVLLFTQQAKAQQPDYVQDEVIKVSNITTDNQIYGLTNAQKQTIRSYYDGLGRSIQTISLQASPAGNDLIQPAAYDNLGRQTVNYLPYAGKSTDVTGSYRNGAVNTDQPAFYNQTSQYLIKTDGKPYSQQLFENSPLQRMLSAGMVGDGFQPGVTGSHYKTISYRPNSSADGNILIWASNGTYTGNAYAANTLSVTDGTDEDGLETLTFTDLEGHTVLKRQISGSGNLDTYYIYNNAGMLSYIVPPKAVSLLVANSYNLTTSPLQNAVFHYTYDNRGRVATKTIPGQGVMLIVYDNWNRPVLMQNAKLREGNKWNYVKYDAKSRAVSQGIYADATHIGQAPMQSYVNGFNTIWYESRSGTLTNNGYYTNTSFPSSGMTALAYAYYDDYDLNQDGTDDFSYATQSDPNLPGEEAATTAKLKGMPTIISKTVMGNGVGTGTGSIWLTSATFYDKRGNAIQVLSNNHVYNTGATALTDSKTVVPDFMGVPQVTKVVKKSSASLTTTVYTSYIYDASNRLLQVSQKYNSGAMLPVASYTYNEIGQLVKKGLGYTGTAAPATQNLNTTYSGTNTITATHSITLSPGFSVPSGSTFTAQIVQSYLQSVSYRYNIRGQLTSINNSTLTDDGGVANDDSNDVFGMQLLYDVADAGLANTAKFNGRITGQKWMTRDGSGVATSERSYKFIYNDLGQYTAENYGERATPGTGSFSGNAGGFDEFGINYDAGGDITSLKRNSSAVGGGTITAIDNLTYTYSTTIPNQLLNVTDAGTTTGFAGGSGNYVYDNNGNLTTDPYKHLSIGYDDLNKTDRITVTNATNRYIDYTYDASGTVLRKRQYDNGVLQQTTDYSDGFVYLNNTLSYFGMPEGRVLNNGGTMVQEFIITDQQGNARVSFQNNGSNVAVVKQENSYYGYGMTLTSAMAIPSMPNKQLYNGGSEWQNDYGNLPDYYQTYNRNYDAALARFIGVDPEPESAESLSSYHYAGNNPIMMNDPLGNEPPQRVVTAMSSIMHAAAMRMTTYESTWQMDNGNAGWYNGGDNDFTSAGGSGANSGFMSALLWNSVNYLNQNTTVQSSLDSYDIPGLNNQYQRDGDNGQIFNAIAIADGLLLPPVTVNAKGVNYPNHWGDSNYFLGAGRGASQGGGNGPGPGQPQPTTSDNGGFWSHLVGPTLIALGQPINALKPIGMLGSRAGSSVASYTLRKIIPGTLKGTFGETIGGELVGLAGTNGLGAALGRFVPVLGVALTLGDIQSWGFHQTLNNAPNDRVREEMLNGYSLGL